MQTDLKLSRCVAYGILEAGFWLCLRCAESLDAITSRWRNRPVAASEIAFVTGYTQPIATYARPIAEQNAAYAARHSYAFYCHTDADFHPTRPPSWSKILFVQRALRRYRWVLWCDADALVMNQRRQIESLLDARCDFIFAKWQGPVPLPHVNCGVFLVQRSLFSRVWLACVWRMRHYIYHYWWEQAAINRLLELGPWRRIRLDSRYRDFNAFIAVDGDPDPYQPGDFIAHLSGYRSTPERTAAVDLLIRIILK